MILPFSTSVFSSSKEASKWFSIACLPRPVTIIISSMPAATQSSTRYWIIGLSMSVSISFGSAFVAGRKLVPYHAARITAFLIGFIRRKKLS